MIIEANKIWDEDAIVRKKKKGEDVTVMKKKKKKDLPPLQKKYQKTVTEEISIGLNHLNQGYQWSL